MVSSGTLSILTSRETQPTPYRSSPPTWSSSCSASRCKTDTKSRSPATTSSIRLIERADLTISGASNPGKRTISLSGSTGSREPDSC